MKRWFWGLLPLALVGLLLGTFVRYGPLGVFRASFPPVEELTIDRAVLPQPHRIILEVTNGGPSPVTVAQVMVDDAFWQFSIEPAGKTIPRLRRSKITIPYPWVEGETHEVTLLTSTGLIGDDQEKIRPPVLLTGLRRIRRVYMKCAESQCQR